MNTTSTCRMHWGVKSSINKRMLLETTNGNQRTPAGSNNTTGTSKGILLQSSPCIVPFVHSVADSTRTCIHHPPYFQPPTPSTHCHHHSIVIVGCRWGRFYWLYKPQCPIHTLDQPIPQTWTGQHGGNRTEQGQNIPRTRSVGINSTSKGHPFWLVVLSWGVLSFLFHCLFTWHYDCFKISPI